MSMVSIYERKMKEGKVTFLLNYTIQGERYRENLKLGSHKKGSKEYREAKQMAELVKAKRTRELLTEEFDINLKKAPRTTLFKYFESFRDEYEGVDKRKVDSMLERYLKVYFEKDKLLRELTVDDCKSFLNHLKRHLRSETIKNYFGLFRRGLQKAVRERIITDNPSSHFRLQLHEAHGLKKDVLSIEDLQALSQTPCGNEEVKRAFLFACNTGITRAEILALKWKDIRNGRLHYARLKTRKNILVSVDLNQNALKLIGPKPDHEGKVFKSLPSEPAVGKCLKNWMKRAGIDKHITFYCARHTFGTLQAEMGANQKVIAQNMGHTSSKHTDKYVNHVDEARMRAVNFPNIS